MSERYQACALVEEGAVGVEVERAVGGNRHDPYCDALACAEQLPWHDVGMVLHYGEDYLIAVFKEAAET